ncbi:TPA: hypothetical protein ACF3P8_002352 [Serratia marcescens]|nr:MULTISPECIES: hypothetical protein [Serratia]ASM06831.1 hypothetical protein BVG91_07215 [Serratia marcescens]MBH2652692.1 hypothetical protein [Serratia ureilytica]
MSERQLAPCWEFQAYLDEASVMNLLAEVAGVLEQLYYHGHTLDSNWSKGVRAYDWVRSHLIKNEKNISGLSMVTKGLDFVLALNKVPLQFSKDCIAAPKKKHRLLRNKAEFEQLSLFGGSEPEAEQDITWRILAEPYLSVLSDDDIDDDEEITLPRWIVALVGFNSYGAAVSEVRYEPVASIPPMSVDSSDLPSETDIEEPDLRKRKKGEDDQDVKDNGTSSD